MIRKIAWKYKPLSTYKEFEHHAYWLLEEPGWEKVAIYVDDWIKKAIEQG